MPEELSLKSRFPFRLGTSSYIIPADIGPNVRFLADKVDDVEIVLFESDEFSNIPEAKIVRDLADIAAEFDLTFTVHLPLDTHMGDSKESVRRASVDKCLHIIDRMRTLKPFSHIFCTSTAIRKEAVRHWISTLDAAAQALGRGIAGLRSASESLRRDAELSIRLDREHRV